MSIRARVASAFGYRHDLYEEERAAVRQAVETSGAAAGLVLVGQLIRAWSINGTNGSRESMRQDLGQLRWLSEEAARLKPEFVDPSQKVIAAVQALDAFYEKKANFWIDGRMPAGFDATREVTTLRDSLDTELAAWRKHIA